MFFIGEPTVLAKRLVQVTFDSMYRGIGAISAGSRVIEIGRAIYEYARAEGFEVVREYQGHGLGREFHQEPGIPHYPHPSTSRQSLLDGMCFTIEPMLNAGTWKTVADQQDGWTVRTADGALSAQWEHTILMTEDGPEILTPVTKDLVEVSACPRSSSSPLAHDCTTSSGPAGCSRGSRSIPRSWPPRCS